jgi:Phage terminase, small subunit
MPKDLPPSTPTIPAPALLNSVSPSHTLGEAGQSLWDRIQNEYAVEDAASVEVLTQLCLAADRRAELAAAITRDGAAIQTEAGLREHPLLKSELAARNFILKALRELGLTQQSIKPVGRPSGLPAMRGMNRNANRSPAARSPDPWGADD